MTPRDWSDGWDPGMRNSGDPAQLPHQNRCLLLGHWIQFLLAITQWVCPICFQRLLREHDLFDMPTIRAALPGLHFDHCIPALKHTTLAGHDYHPNLYWYQLQMILDFPFEKRSGCFVHMACHHLTQ
jgi:hypothetical protein